MQNKCLKFVWSVSYPVNYPPSQPANLSEYLALKLFFFPQNLPKAIKKYQVRMVKACFINHSS